MTVHEYLHRIHYQGSLEPTLETLQALHEAHLLSVPFENLSIHAGQPIILQEEALFTKIVHQHRGGFCYELNGLFAWLLRQLGFQVTLLSAGVYAATGSFGPASDHLTLRIHQLSGADWVADVGFGDSFRRPLRLEAETEQDGADGGVYRLHREDEECNDPSTRDAWLMQQRGDATWHSQYRFTLQPHTLPDFTQRCHYHQASPLSHFTQHRICSLATPVGRISLSDQRLITTIHHERKERVLATQEEYITVLAEHFGIIL